MNQFGYRTGNLIAGVGTIALASPEGFGLGWATAYAFTGLAVLPAVIGALFAGPGRFHPSQARGGAQGFAAWLNEMVISPFREFLGRHRAVLILLLDGKTVAQGQSAPGSVHLAGRRIVKKTIIVQIASHME